MGLITIEQEASPFRRVTLLAFLSRFSMDEYVAIDMASIGDTVKAATVRAVMARVNAASATYVDLDRPDTRAGVYVLVTLGLLSEERAEEILTAPVQPIEIPTK